MNYRRYKCLPISTIKMIELPSRRDFMIDGVKTVGKTAAGLYIARKLPTEFLQKEEIKLTDHTHYQKGQISPSEYLSQLGIPHEKNLNFLKPYSQELQCTQLNQYNEGKCSYYTYAGCLGCNAERRMANNEILDDAVPTLAYNIGRLNRYVLIENLDTGLSIIAKVTDRGGFDKPPYYRLADLNWATASAIGLETDRSRIRITELDCRWVEPLTPEPMEPEPEPEEPLPDPNEPLGPDPLPFKYPDLAKRRIIRLGR